MLRRIPFEYIAATGYLIGNITLTFRGVLFDGRPLIPSIENLKEFDFIAYQTLAGFTFIIIASLLFFAKKYPDKTIKTVAGFNYFAYACLILSGVERDAFLAHVLGILPWFFAATLMFQGNKINDRKTFLANTL